MDFATVVFPDFATTFPPPIYLRGKKKKKKSSSATLHLFPLDAICVAIWLDWNWQHLNDSVVETKRCVLLSQPLFELPSALLLVGGLISDRIRTSKQEGAAI